MAFASWKSVASAAMLASLFAIPAHAKTQVGVLTCHISAGTGMIIGSQRGVRCDFDPAGKAHHQHYSGKISRIGIDVGFTNGGTMAWAVFAPSGKVGRGALRGNYVGASGDASVGVGGGANVLVGGSNNTISLQPLSVQGQTGLNAALGIAELELR
jgi:hypothetical protein